MKYQQSLSQSLIARVLYPFLPLKLDVIAFTHSTPLSSTIHYSTTPTMSDTAFRKIDIDALDEDVLSPSDLYDPDPRGPDGVLSDAKARSNEARGLVSK